MYSVGFKHSEIGYIESEGCGKPFTSRLHNFNLSMEVVEKAGDEHGLLTFPLGSVRPAPCTVLLATAARTAWISQGSRSSRPLRCLTSSPWTGTRIRSSR